MAINETEVAQLTQQARTINPQLRQKEPGRRIPLLRWNRHPNNRLGSSQIQTRHTLPHLSVQARSTQRHPIRQNDGRLPPP